MRLIEFRNRKKIIKGEKIMKRFGILILVLAFIVSMTSGCGQSKKNGDSTAKVNLTFTGIGLNLEDGINPLTNKNYQGWNTFVKEQFAKKFPNVNLTVNTIPWDNNTAKMQTILQSNSTDLLYASASFTGAFYGSGLLMNLNKFMDTDKTFNYEKIYPAGLKTSYNLTDYTGKTVVALPFILGYRIIVYDKQIFDDWGVPYLSDHPTPQEILQDASKMTGKNPKTGVRNYGVWAQGNSLNLSWILSAGYAFGVTGCEGSLNKPSALKWSINSPQSVQTLQWASNLTKYMPAAFVNGVGNEKFGTKDNDIAIGLDVTGVNIMAQYNATSDQSLLDRYIPTQGLGPKGEGWVVADGIGMSSKVKPADQAVAWDVLKYLASAETEKWYSDNFGPSPMGVKDTSFYNPKDKYILANAKEVENAPASIYDSGNPFYTSDIQPDFQSIISNVAAGKNVDVQADLDSLQKKAVAWSANQ
jgi:multiple sugar transport system substrate-binding protein